MNTVFDQLTERSRGLARRVGQPSWLNPTLATLVHESFSSPDWIFEPKLDGERCLMFREGEQVSILSRNRKRLDDTYPEIAHAVAQQSEVDFIVDGEIVAFARNISSFSTLQQRMQLNAAEHHDVQQVPVYCYIFDIMHVAGWDVTALPLRDRKKVLTAAISFADPLRWTPYENADGQDYYARACRAGWEGAIAKAANNPYEHGRSRSWLKFKCVSSQELVIGGFTEPGGSRTGLGALLVGYYEDDRFVYAGKVGTGFTDAELRELRSRLDELERRGSPFAESVRERGAHWVAPQLVANFSFTEWTEEGKLRHPSYLGLREDKDPADVTRERPT